MFQYAAAEVLGTRIGRPVTIDLGFFEANKKKITKRNYCLDLLHEKNVRTLNDSRGKFLFKLQYPFLKISARTLFLQKIDWNKLDYYRKFKKIILDGYFFDLDMLEKNRLVIESAFTFNKNLFQSASSLLDGIVKRSSVSIHVRRGDYLNAANKKIYEVCDKEYYLDAIEHIKSKIDHPYFYIFSDDIEWVEKELRFQNTDYQFVHMTTPDKDIVEFFLMAQCRHNIIANSTYSWWAGFLNSQPGKIVVAPKHWYKDEIENKRALRLLPSDWTVL